jgi:hypothetical protein
MLRITAEFALTPLLKLLKLLIFPLAASGLAGDARGRKFESCRPDQLNQWLMCGLFFRGLRFGGHVGGPIMRSTQQNAEIKRGLPW